MNRLPYYEEESELESPYYAEEEDEEEEEEWDFDEERAQNEARAWEEQQLRMLAVEATPAYKTLKMQPHVQSSIAKAGGYALTAEEARRLGLTR